VPPHEAITAFFGEHADQFKHFGRIPILLECRTNAIDANSRIGAGERAIVKVASWARF
jgi:hypothetical protein